MTKQEAYETMKEGYKITHKYFDDYEYLYMKNGYIYSEEGYNFEKGWKIRKGVAWKNGWSIYLK